MARGVECVEGWIVVFLSFSKMSSTDSKMRESYGHTLLEMGDEKSSDDVDGSGEKKEEEGLEETHEHRSCHV